jgi:hypothetical protein
MRYLAPNLPGDRYAEFLLQAAANTGWSGKYVPGVTSANNATYFGVSPRLPHASWHSNRIFLIATPRERMSGGAS